MTNCPCVRGWLESPIVPVFSVGGSTVIRKSSRAMPPANVRSTPGEMLSCVFPAWKKPITVVAEKVTPLAARSRRTLLHFPRVLPRSAIVFHVAPLSTLIATPSPDGKTFEPLPVGVENVGGRAWKA